jgi:putative acyl-CoA dehydrogenase
MPRLYRDSPLNSIWEGSGNVTALDLLRALRRQPAAAGALTAELALAAGADRRLDEAARGLAASLARLTDATGPDAEYAARRLAGQITLTLQAALLVRHAPATVADSFCASRLGTGDAAPGGPGVPFGTLPDGIPAGEILDRARLVPR